MSLSRENLCYQTAVDHLGSVSEQVRVTRHTRTDVGRISRATNDTEQLVGQTETGLRDILLLHRSLADQTLSRVERHDCLATDTRSHLQRHNADND